MSLTQPYDESALLERLQTNAHEGFQELYDRFAATFLRLLITIVRNEEQAEDILQDSFVKIWLYLDHFDPEKGRLYTWMLTIVRNTAFRALHTPVYCTLEESTLETLPAIYLPIDLIGLASWVESTLNTTEQAIIDLIYFQGYTLQQVSDEFGYPLGSVKTWVRRALQKLRNNV